MCLVCLPNFPDDVLDLILDLALMHPFTLGIQFRV